MSSVFGVRKGNLQLLASEHGGAAKLAQKLGHANSSRLSQLIGSGATDKISETIARSIEEILNLPAGFLDQDRIATDHEPTAKAFGNVLRDFAEAVGTDSLHQISEERFAEVCALLLHEFRASGKVTPDSFSAWRGSPGDA